MISIREPESPPTICSGNGVLRPLLYGIGAECLILLCVVLAVLSSSTLSKRKSIVKAATGIEDTVFLLAPLGEKKKNSPAQTPTQVLPIMQPHAAGAANARLGIRFATDSRQDLAVALTKYGGMLGFGGSNIAEFRFAPPAWDEVKPRKPMSITQGMYPILVQNPRPDSFVGEIRSKIDRGDSSSLDTYALFPLEFQDVLEAEILKAAAKKCLGRPSNGIVEFTRESPLGIKIVSVTCDSDAKEVLP